MLSDQRPYWWPYTSGLLLIGYRTQAIWNGPRGWQQPLVPVPKGSGNE